MRALQTVCLFFGCLFLAACGGATANSSTTAYLPQAAPVDPPTGSQMLTANTYAGDALHRMLLSRMDAGKGILVASLVELDDFERSSTFGRLASQQIGSRLGQYGFRVLEVRLGSNLRMDRRGGEFMLTRDSAKLLSDSYDAGAVLLGCYSEIGNTMYVSVRIVRLSDSAIMGAYEYYLPRTGETRAMLTGGTGAKKDGGDAVWRRYAMREMAFAPERTATSAAAGKTAVPHTDSAAGGRPEMLNSTGGTGAPAGGKVIDPSAAPTPFPKGARRR